MILSKHTTSKVVLLFAIFHFLFSIQAVAQVPAGIDPNNLSSVKVDELSNDQINAIFKMGQGSGITINQAEQIAKSRGLPDSEIKKLLDRLSTNNQLVNTNNSKISPTDSINLLNLKAISTEYDALNTNTNTNIKSDIYGRDLFRNGNIKVFDKSIDAKPSSGYVIGVGDEFGISVYGYSYYNEVLKVDSRGAITPAQMGPIFVKGMTFEKAKILIKGKMNQYFDLKNNTIDITLAYSRSITVNIVGEVVNPGSYKFPALNTAFNALILAGGPNDIGTLRNIQIRRDGKTVKYLDIYQFLNNPNSNIDYYLQDNDYIVVGPAKKIVTILGEVNKPGTFELLEKEKSQELLQYAAGYKSSAYTSKIKIKRNLAKEIIYIDVNIDSLIKLKKDIDLVAGDTILVSPNVSDVINKVIVLGSVNFPGDYSFKKGEKISDLLNKAGGVKFDANLQTAFLIRKGDDLNKQYFHINLNEVLSNINSQQNLELKTMDLLNIYSKKDFITPLNVEVFGEVKSPGKLDCISGVTLFDVIVNSGGFNIEAENLRIEISRLNYFQENYVDGQDVRVIVESIQLSSNNIFDCAEAKNIKIYPFDQIFVRTVPNFMVQENITLKGEVKYPGIYSLKSKNEKVADVIKRAGGLSKFAYPEAATFYRETLLGNYIVFDLENALKHTSSKYNYTLKNGDVINIPTVNDFVSIQGSSIEYLDVVRRSQVNAPYVNNKRAKYYINKFGNGFTKDSWKKKTYVIQPNAKVNHTTNFVLFKVYPKVTKGSTIYVINKPIKENKRNKNKQEFDLNKFIENTMVKFTGIITLYFLFQKI